MAVSGYNTFGKVWAQALEQEVASHILFQPSLLQYPPNGADEYGPWIMRTDVHLNDHRVQSVRLVWTRDELRATILVLKLKALVPFVRPP